MDSLARRFAEKIEPEPNSGCWLWLGAIADDGYGRTGVRINGRREQLTHRVVYHFMRGPIPSELQLDHLCRMRSCVNPAHLEPVTSWENTHRGQGNPSKRACPSGHPYTPDNTIVREHTQGPRRHCRACQKAKDERRRSPGAVHNALKTHCPRAHAYTPENTYMARRADGVRRHCRTCTRERFQQQRAGR